MPTVIELITPIVTEGVRSLDDVKALESEALSVRHSLIDIGPSSIESEFDEALAVPGTLEKAIAAEKAGAQAIVIDCMGDPGLRACRETVGIPVVGAGQAALHFANMLGCRFSFITVLERIRPMMDHIIRGYGLSEHYASFRAIDIPVLSLSEDITELQRALAKASAQAIDQDGADAIILGCTGFFGCAEAIRESLAKDGYGKQVPVIDPIPVAIHLAETLAKLGLSHSKISFPSPDDKPIKGFTIPGFKAA